MGHFGYCHDDYEHRNRAKDDARWDTPDHEYYDRHTSDPCKEVYTETFDRERERREEERREEERQQEREEERRYHEMQMERQREEYEMEREYYERELEPPQPDGPPWLDDGPQDFHVENPEPAK